MTTEQKPRFGIAARLFSTMLLIVAVPIACLVAVSAYMINSRSEQDFLARASAELSQVGNVVDIMLENAILNLEMVAAEPSVAAIDDSINSYAGRADATSMKTVSRSPLERNILGFFRLVTGSHPDYVELYVGTRWGGFVTDQDDAVRGGYDPRQRP